MKWIWKNRAAKIATRRWYLITVNEHFPQVLPMLIIPVLPYPCKTDCPLVSPACNPFNSVVAAPEPGTGRARVTIVRTRDITAAR